MQPTIRSMKESDKNFVRDTWLKTFWDQHMRGHIEWNTYYEGQAGRINNILDRAYTIVAYFPEIPDEILGWATLEVGRKLHFMYVKKVYRGQGIGTGLVDGRAACYTHATDRKGRAFLEKLGIRYNPYA